MKGTGGGEEWSPERNGTRKGTGRREEQGLERNGAWRGTGPGEERGPERDGTRKGTGHRKGVRDSGREQRTGKDRKTNQ